MRSKIGLHLALTQSLYPVIVNKTIQIYADDDEVEDMAQCHKRSLSLLGKFMEDISHLGTESALEVAAGDGQATRDLLHNYFKEVDCFDQCPIAVKKLESLQESIFEIKRVD